MHTYDVGDRVRLSVVFALDDVPTNTTTVALGILAPDGTVTEPAPISDGGGHYHADLDLTLSGRWDYRYVGTGVVPAAAQGALLVRPLNVPETP